jgi:bacillithiol biosynthesis deacetylase BshB2
VSDATPRDGDWTVDGPVARRHLLVVLPHPDDESFSSAGTMAMHADAGVPVTFLCGTYGDMGRNMGRPFFANRETLRDVREREAREACRILGADLAFLGLRDKTVEFEDPDEVAARIAEVIRERAADLVISFYPGKAVHPDHDALGEATVRAVRRLPEVERPTVWAVAVGPPEQLEEELGRPDVRVDIRAYAERKLAALEAHATQTKAMFERLAAGSDQDEHLRKRLEEGRRTESFYALDPDRNRSAG